ncbi:DNA sulfur modification protein DndE [Paracoccaceae bacterium]|nr:DNA sulfur modification protein DndE [Paracoccaceae bacterium]
MKRYPLKSFQLSTEILDQISVLKRKTGITKNNIICRWAFYCSLTLEGNPIANRKLNFPEDGKGEISWEVFGGEQAPLLAQLLVERSETETEQENLFSGSHLKDTLLAHINRGLSHLIGKRKVSSISDLARVAINI